LTQFLFQQILETKNKSLYIDGVKKEIFKYEVLYNEGHQRNIIEKLKKLKITTFQTNPTAFNALTSWFDSVPFSTDFRNQEASNDFHDELK
jgi:hypothetical protein